MADNLHLYKEILMPPNTLIRSLVRWGLYPLSWLILLFGFYRLVILG